MQRWQKNVLIVAFLISLLVHFGSGIAIYLHKLPTHPQSVEITIIDKQEPKTKQSKTAPLKNDARQIVEQDEHRVNDETDKKAKYLSRYNQKVVEETKAANHGKFQNDAKQGEAPKALQQKQVNNQPTKKNLSPQDANEKPLHQRHLIDRQWGDLPTLTQLKPQFHWEKVQEQGVKDPGRLSQTDDHLKDVITGPQTLLSSREFVYYSYYSRIKERLRLFWEPKIKEKINRLFMAGRHVASEEERITRLVITLDKTGKLIRVQVLGESGLKDLDDAAVEAFQAAAPFPNPPHGIVEADGTIKIRWDFILEANAAIYDNARLFAHSGYSDSF